MTEISIMDGLSKKQRTDEVSAADNVEVDARECIFFIFDDSKSRVKPEFVHQNFGEAGKFSWPKELMPVSVDIHVNTRGKMCCQVRIEHGGSADSALAISCKAELVRRLSYPCELSDGCRPADYPDSLTRSVDLETELGEPSSTDKIHDGFTVLRFRSREFEGQSFNMWRRAEWLMLWFIESVSRSDHESDPNWEYFFLFHPDGGIVSFCSVYRFPSFAFLSQGFIGDRLRLSQFLSIPSAWNQGFGSILLRFLADYVLGRSDVDKLTMEDPSFGMSSVRETVYLQIAGENNLLRGNMPLQDLQERLKIPRVFSKRLKVLLEIRTLMQGHVMDSQLIEKILLSGNRYVQKFIDSIEFYDDGAMGENDEPALDKTAADALVRERLSQTLRKLKRAGG
jgi:GNAT superfamily N-acetyltransferase